MKYRQLTKEQFQSLHKEFAQFLATQSIDAKQWSNIKSETPKVALEIMDVFSDIVWDDVLKKTNYVEHFSEKTINLFKCNNQEIKRIVIKVSGNKNVLKNDDFTWLLKNPFAKEVEIFKGTKIYNLARNKEIFDLIEKGAFISNGNLFKQFNQLTS